MPRRDMRHLLTGSTFSLKKKKRTSPIFSAHNTPSQSHSLYALWLLGNVCLLRYLWILNPTLPHCTAWRPLHPKQQAEEAGALLSSNTRGRYSTYQLTTTPVYTDYPKLYCQEAAFLEKINRERQGKKEREKDIIFLVEKIIKQTKKVKRVLHTVALFEDVLHTVCVGTGVATTTTRKRWHGNACMQFVWDTAVAVIEAVNQTRSTSPPTPPSHCDCLCGRHLSGCTRLLPPPVASSENLGDTHMDAFHYLSYW